jgi:kynurenine formamidase
MTTDVTVPSRDEVISYLRDRRNWGRWGDGDQRGAINLITPEKRVRAAQLVRSGRSVSLSRDYPKIPGRNNPMPAQHFLQVHENAVTDYYGIMYHGYVTTHVDALCHVWDEGGMWGGHKAKDEIDTMILGTHWGGIEHWRDGITTRGVLLDVPKFRSEPYVTIEKPVHGAELEAIAKAQGVALEPGDALVVYSGREAYQADHRDWSGYRPPSPGLHASCLPFLRDNDVSVLAWDLMDATPNEYGLPWTVHGAIFSYGIALLDNSLLQPLAEACAAEGRHEFMLTFAPIPVVGGTGSPVNPIALF